jgi:hypothetical protein
VTLLTPFCAAKNADELSDYYGFDEIEIIKSDFDIGGLTIADFDDDNRNDILISNNQQARLDIYIQLKSAQAAEEAITVAAEDENINLITPMSRYKRQSIAVSEKIDDVVAGDLNGDGKIDIAYCGKPEGLYVLLAKNGDTSKTKLTWHNRQKIKLDNIALTPNSLVCADINNDQRDDLIIMGKDCVYLVIQKKDGSLSSPEKYPALGTPRAVRVCDLNGDKINDLMISLSDRNNPVSVRFGLPTGKLGAQQHFEIDYPWSLQTADIDADGADEVVTIDALGGRLIAYELGNDTATQAKWPVKYYPLPSGEKSKNRALVTADFDADNLLDVVISDPDGAELIMYRQLPGTGLSQAKTFPALDEISSLAVEDIDNDNAAELFVLSVKEKTLGISRFESNRLTFPKPVNVTGEPLSMVLADADADGNCDLVYISRDENKKRKLYIINNIAETLKSADPNAGTEVFNFEKLQANPDGIKAMDFDQDGLCDFMVFVKYEDPIVLRQTEPQKFEKIEAPQSQASLVSKATTSSLSAADIDDKPGDEVIICQKNFARSLRLVDGKKWTVIDQYNAAGTDDQIMAAAAFNIPPLSTAQRPAIFLLDSKTGNIHLLTAADDQTYRFQRKIDVGKWVASPNFKWLYSPLKGDNDKCMLLFDGQKFGLITIPDNGGRCPALERMFSYETKITEGVYGNMITGDINNDKRSDIVMVEYRHNHIEILALDADYKPIPAMRFKIFEEKQHGGERDDKSSVQPRYLRIADVTNDGKNDLVTIIHDRLIIYPQD